MRKYRPEIGRWMSRDPIGEGNVFLYVALANNFICVFDLLGLISPNKVKTDCEDAIAFKRAENNYVIKNPSPIDSMTEKKCNEMVDKIKSFNPVKPLLEQFSEDNNCPEPKISCSCCNWYENTEGVRKASTLGSYSASSGITLCWNNIEAGLENGKDMTIELNKVLAHELTHALQSCRGYPIDCIGDLKREMEARICSNECRNFDECIIMALASSCGRKCNDPAIILHGLTDLQKWFFDKTRKGKGRPGGFCDFFRKKIRKR